MSGQYAKGQLKLFALNSNVELAEKVANVLNTTLSTASVKHFSDGEIQINIDESIRGADIYIIQSISNPVNENLMELLIMVDALRRASAGTINVVMPYYGYARSDRKARSREPITAKLVANFIQLAGVSRVITLDLHAAQLQGFFNIPVDHLVSLEIQAKYFIENGITDDVVVVSPDHNSVKGARNMAEKLKAQIAIVDKRGSDFADNSAETSIIGDVKGRRCIVIDDMIDTGTMMTDAARALKAAGATDIYACATHAVMSEGAIEALSDDNIKQVIVTDSIVVPEADKLDKLVRLSVADLFGQAIDLIHKNRSVDKLFTEKN
ncbi:MULTISPECIES: ribose-phosphate diphosphokinase [Dellaglioa]|uniref:Ribose-phosphate pyrophosphokinase n=3 Tax=Dellaglioa TaxID=2767880 RepID=A0A0R1HQM9_9LACO|nr:MULTISPECIES: ribose-phosphate pyrophosphokinase [Dellaglioa]KRK45482.1 ribose-phosphate pyrophosphokinase [Dellaglioa algida DSM 15638]MCZ2491631.1 ribose-phosphate pyrophosphokinase [Dellaglioa carnosa]MCZ2493091.1 ribose-phosphate pyrophosphokinase [Dellaglioa carnosa]MCZ2494708.1 ribose-phosphate pyrophosphokinase [Dellaglioa carnosa]MDK1717484.1 ribose-phosphate pyrophosphokinase [Dellaglioa algida]